MLSEVSLFPKVSILILNWNGWSDTVECLESVFQLNYPMCDVVLVDNGSTDDSIERIKEYCSGNLEINSRHIKFNSFNKPINVIEYTCNEILRGKYQNDIPVNDSMNHLRFIKNKRNFLYVLGNNIPIQYFILKELKPDYILLLNNDTVVEPNFLKELIKITENDENIGIAAPKVCSYEDEKEIYHSSEGKTLILDYIFGSAFLIRKELIHSIGLLDPSYIHYYEDIDYCLKARRAGFKVIYVPTESKVFHKGGKSSKKVHGLISYLKARNNLIFIKKQFHTWKFLINLIYFLTKGLIIELIKHPKEKKAIFYGTFSGLKLILNLKKQNFQDLSIIKKKFMI